MPNIDVPPRIHQIISLFHCIRLWRSDDVSYSNSMISKILHLVVYIYYPVSLMAGAFTNDNEAEKMFLVVLSIVTFVLAIRLFYILWKKDRIIGFIHKLGRHTITDGEQYHRVNDKIMIFIKLVTFMELMLLFAVIAMTIITSPIVSTKKMLPMNIYLPFDWKHNDLLYWIAFAFVIYEMMISMTSSLMNPIIWYLMISCASKYQLIGHELKGLGNVVSSSIAIGDKDSYQMQLISKIKDHHDLQKCEAILTVWWVSK